jgi:hypothetical protein
MMNNFKRTWSFIILLFASSFLIPFSSCGSKEGTSQSAEEVEEAGTTVVGDAEHPEGDKSEHPKAEDAEHPKSEDSEHPKKDEAEHPKDDNE